MFLHLYRLLSVYSLLRLPRRSISVASTGLNLPVKTAVKSTVRSQTVNCASECIDSLAAFQADEFDEFDDIDGDPSTSNSVAQNSTNNIVYYVAGYVVRHCRNITKCIECLAKLSSANCSASYTVLTETKCRGALCWPSDVLFHALCKLEAVVASYLKNEFNPFILSAIIEDGLPAMLPVRAMLCQTHGSWLAAEISVYYACTRLHWHAKSSNREATSRIMTKTKRKTAKLC